MNKYLYRATDTARHVYWRAAKPHTRGVKVFAMHPDQDSVLLIRNNYGDEEVYTLPGGGIKRRENAEQAATREVREEAGVGIVDLFRLGEDFVNTVEYKTDIVTTIGARAVSSIILPNQEIAEARWCNIDEVDDIAPLSGFVRRAISAYRDKL